MLVVYKPRQRGGWVGGLGKKNIIFHFFFTFYQTKYILCQVKGMIVKFTKSPFRGKESLYEMKKYLSHLSCTVEVQSVPIGVVCPLARDLRGLRGEGCGWLGSWLGHGLGKS